MSDVLLDSILGSIHRQEIGFLFNYSWNRPLLSFTDKNVITYLLPDPIPILDPTTFKPVYFVKVIIYDNGGRSVKSISTEQYDMILGRIEDELGKTIDEISFGMINYVGR